MQVKQQGGCGRARVGVQGVCGSVKAMKLFSCARLCSSSASGSSVVLRTMHAGAGAGADRVRIPSMELRFYGHFHGTGGDPGNKSSSRYLMSTVTDEGNLHLVRNEFLRFNEKWEPCDVGVLDSVTGTCASRVVDKSQRSCFRGSTDAWIEKRSLVHEQHGAAELIAKALPLVDLSTVGFSDWELLRYTAGGFFAEHVDRPRGDNHLGTVLAIFGTDDVEGGDLQSGGKVVWPRGCKVPHLVFIPLGEPHEVTRVLKGERYAAKAAVYGKMVSDVAKADAANEDFRRSHMRCD